MLFAPYDDHERRLRIFLESWTVCDAPWPYKSELARMLPFARGGVGSFADLLSPKNRAFFDQMPDPISIHRGCERGRERGLSWTTDLAIAEGFARGKRCRHSVPTLCHATIRKAHVFGAFTNRDEHEIIVDPRRLRQFRAAHL
jgi:hypothetical protein